MLIAIDAHMVGERETGNETYTLSLIQALLRISARDPKGFSWDLAGPPNATQTLPSTRRNQQRRFGDSPRFHLLATHPERLRAALSAHSSGPEQTLPPHASIERIRPENALLRIPFAMPIQALRGAYDLLHVTYNAPPLCPCPTVVTIHDISFEHYPQFFSPRDRLILKTLVPLSARRARRIITVSEHAKREIMACYDIPADKITVTYEAAGEQFRPITDLAALQAVRAKYGIPEGPFILALGNLQPRKNIRRLVEAYARLDLSSRKVQSGLIETNDRSDRSSKNGPTYACHRRQGAMARERDLPGGAGSRAGRRSDLSRLRRRRRPARACTARRPFLSIRRCTRASACLRSKPWPAAHR